MARVLDKSLSKRSGSVNWNPPRLGNMGGHKYKTDVLGSGAEERGSPGQGQGEIGEPEPTRRDETSRAHEVMG
jgi:hypothetical protein